MKSSFCRVVFIWLGLQATAGCLKAQSIAEIDSQLAHYLTRIQYWDNYDYQDTTVDKYDCLDKANTQLTSYLLLIGNKVPGTLTAQFPKAEKNRLSVTSSVDKKLRLYSWNTRLGGTMENYGDIAQFNASGEVRAIAMKDSTEGRDFGCSFENITAICDNSNKQVYLVFTYSKFSNKDRGEGVGAYIIERHRLKEYKFFKTKTKTLSSISYGYDLFSSSDKLKRDFDDLPTIHLSKDKSQLFVPVVGGPYGEDLTDKYLIYKFNGSHYVYSGIGTYP